MNLARLVRGTFLEVVKSAPLVAVDLIVRDSAGRVLVGLRRNAPARNSWFVPGGRIIKGESLADALRRVGREELGTEPSADSCRFVGVFEHIYPDNFAGLEGVGTHYIVLAHEVRLRRQIRDLPDAQHLRFRWLELAELAQDEDVHPYTRAYARVLS